MYSWNSLYTCIHEGGGGGGGGGDRYISGLSVNVTNGSSQMLKDYEDLQKTSSNWPPSFIKKQWGSQEDGLRTEEQTSYMKM